MALLAIPAPYSGVVIDLAFQDEEYGVLVSYMDDITDKLSERKGQEFIAWMLKLADYMTKNGTPTVVHIEALTPRGLTPS